MRKIFLLLAIFPISSFANVQKMNSNELALYANELQVHGQGSTTFSNNQYSQSQPTNAKSGYRSVNYSTPNQYQNRQNQVQNVQNVQTSDSSWVSDYVKSKQVSSISANQYQNKKQEIRYSNKGDIATQNYSSGRKANLSCVIQAARSEGVPLYVLLGIQSKERGQNGAVNETNDLGHFQVNMMHFRQNGMFSNVNMELARTDGCLNARLAAKVLKNRLQTKPNEDFWVRAAAYHSWTPHLNALYRNGTSKNGGLIYYSNQWRTWLTQNGIDPN